MDSQDRVARCAARLQDEWPRRPDEQLRVVAEDLRRNAQRQLEAPEHAAVEWLRHGMPNAR